MDVFRDKQNVFFYVKEIIEKRFDFLATILNDKISNEPIITYSLGKVILDLNESVS
jgi:hypothetical protein